MPNLLLLWTDQQRYDTLAAYGNRAIRMPNLDALAETATTFERAYCTMPVCTPSRGSVMTGLYPHAHGAVWNNVPLPTEQRCLPELVPQGDYATAYIGKWHLGDEIFPQHGFDTWRGTDDGYKEHYSPGRDPEARGAYHHWLVARGYRPPGDHFGRDWQCALPECDSKPRFQADETVAFIHENAGSPWVCSVNTLEPHHPLPSALGDTYDPATLPVRGNFFVPPGADKPLRTRLLSTRIMAHGFERYHMQDATSWRRAKADYWALCTMVDRHYGRILDALRETGQFDETMIVFTSDHGEMMGSHQLFGKGVPYEESTHVPLLVKLPGQTEARRVAQPVSLVDLLPTQLDVLGHAMPDGLHGRSLRTLCEGGEETPRDVVVQWLGGSQVELFNASDAEAALAPAADLRAAVEADYRTLITPERLTYTLYATGEQELYDLRTDPFELENLAPNAPPAQLAELRARLTAWQTTIADPGMPGLAP